MIRLARRLPDLSRLSMVEFDRMAIQFKLYRLLCGGIFVRMNGVWHGCTICRVLQDGTRILTRDGGPQGCCRDSFHETFNGIERLEDIK